MKDTKEPWEDESTYVPCVCNGCGNTRTTFVGDCCISCMAMYRESPSCQGRYVAIETEAVKT